jgi:hypothetical protein
VTTTSQVAPVIDWLVQAAQTAAQPGGTLAGVSVWDGPQPSLTTQAVSRDLWVGADIASPGDLVAEASQRFPVMDHARTRDEDGVITCSAQHWSGDTRNQVHRDGAAAIVAGVELLLRGDQLTGGPGDASMGGLVMWSGVDGPFQWYPRQVAAGTAMLVVFRISYRARLKTS